jgi:hypothetical protein
MHPTKTRTELITLQELTAAPRVALGTAHDVATKVAADFYVRIARSVATALTAAVAFRFEGSPDTSGDNWYEIAQRVASSIVAANSTTVASGGGVGSSSVTLTSGTGYARGDLAFFKNGTLANSEFRRVAAVATNTITLEEPLANDQSAATVLNKAEQWRVPASLWGVRRARVVVDGSGAGQNFIAHGVIVTTDEFTS